MHACISEQAGHREPQLGHGVSVAEMDDCFESSREPMWVIPPVAPASRRILGNAERSLLQQLMAHTDAAVADAIECGKLNVGTALAVLTELMRGVERIDPEAAEQLIPERALRVAKKACCGRFGDCRPRLIAQKLSPNG